MDVRLMKYTERRTLQTSIQTTTHVYCNADKWGGVSREKIKKSARNEIVIVNNGILDWPQWKLGYLNGNV